MARRETATEDEMITNKANYRGETFTAESSEPFKFAVCATDKVGGRKFVAIWCRTYSLASAELKRFSSPTWLFGDLEIVEL